jgi:hypothetical protein
MKNITTQNPVFSGNVGIGTTNPATNHKLHIRNTETANFRIERNKVGNTNSQNGYLQITAAEGSNLIYSKDLDGNAKKFVIDAGNVGIGVTNPDSNLHIEDSVAPVLTIGKTGSQAADVNLGVIQFKNNDGSHDGPNIVSSITCKSVNSVGSGGYLSFSTHPGGDGNSEGSSPTTRMTIEGSGNVGIGTTNPGNKLHIAQGTLVGGSTNSNTSLTIEDALNTGIQFLSATQTQLRFGDADSDGAGSIIYRHSDNLLRLNTTGKISLEGGNVGIGTTNPIYAKLQVHGDSAATRAGLLISDASGRTSAVHQVGNNLLFDDFTSGSTRMVINGSSGNVGIGTTNPGGKLTVAGDMYLGTYGSTTSADNKMYYIKSAPRNWTGVDSVTDDIAAIGMGAELAGYDDGLITFHTATNVDTGGSLVERMRIKYNGNVGIGTTNPDFNLSVVSNTDPAKIGIHGYGSFSDGTVAAQLLFLGKDSNGNNRNLAHIQVREHSHASGTGSMEFFTRKGGNEAARMTISYAGNVGIGTTDPGNYKLQVNSNANTWATLIKNDSASPYGLAIQYPTGSPSNTDNQFIQCYTGSAVMFRVHSNGNVVSASNSYTSDDRIKHNEEKIVNAIETLSKITPKKYFKTSELYDANHDFDLDSDGNPVDENGEPVSCVIEAGVIAQEVLGVEELKFTVSPELKDEDGNVASPHGLDYNSLFTYAIAAIQEQQQIIEDLKSRIETLEQ